VSQHANERKVRTLEEDDEVVSSLGGEPSAEVDSVSADNDECDLEELASVENLEDNTDDDVDDDDDDDDDARQLEDSSSSGIPSVDVGNSEDIGNSSLQDNNADISEDVVTLAPSTGQAGVRSSDEESFEDTIDTVGQVEVAKVDTETTEVGAGSQNEKVSDIVEEFPDTSIELQHVSGNKLVFSLF